MAGGGTGGHLFPALALASELKEGADDVEIIFVGAVGGLEEKIIPKEGYELKVFKVEGLKKKKGRNLLRGLMKAVMSTYRSYKYLKEIKPDGAIGSGGYSSGPVLLAAKLLGIKTAILEQNLMPGLTNRILGKIVDRVYVAFDGSKKYFKESKTVLTGNPVRKSILRSKDAIVGKSKDKFTILVFGGSQGATAVNASFTDATEYLTDIWRNFNVIHQAGAEGYDTVKQSYNRKNLDVELYNFIDDMSKVYKKADLVVCRAGATSIAEITALGIASIMIPYPFASDNHQEVNARYLDDIGASVMLAQDELTGKQLADTVRELYNNPVKLKTMQDKSKEFGRVDAAKEIKEDFLGLFTATP